ncbi:MAG TPA: DUF1992 domain-containing protein [Methylomusa anaerophila]|uniref:DnaJ homologue subfamily C member 28 conserved domain-containing protein n=1 Tax=Methylomusa anaerophila TaxID=1930071 RepID=A0A348AP28_9FIRM|nr:DnaJ family domain-containing protein [Methylomusa anaerophila]BBB92826.1 hypothetical protein MAMMFC1_03532 [Methylomusa anaerophila]HML87334.1 DUF1992 domain-containing protein [Methylomusa anaerophila]
MKDLIIKIAEEKILEAIENGELDNLPGKGKPLDLQDCCHIPPELRAGYKILKNAGLLPEEMELQKEIAALEKFIADCQQEDEKESLRKKLIEKNLYYDILMEKRRRR